MDDKDKQITIIVTMVIVLVCLLSGLVAFGHMSYSQTYTPPPAYGYVNGTVFYKDGVTPLIVNDTGNGDYLYLSGPNSEKMVTDSNGYFSSVNVPPGTYNLFVYRNNQNIGYIYSFSVNSGQTVTENVTTSRTPTLKLFFPSFVKITQMEHTKRTKNV